MLRGVLPILALCLSWPAQAQERAVDPALRAPPSEGGVRRWQGTDVPLFATPDDAGTALASESDLLSNLGCDADGWCAVAPFGGGATRYARAADLRPAVGPDGVVATGIDDSGKRAKRKRFDATAEVPCAQERGQDMARCQVGVARSGGGDATAAATFQNGFVRLLTFEHGRFVRANTTMSGTGRDVEWSLTSGVYKIRVDDQRFEVPVAFVIGG